MPIDVDPKDVLLLTSSTDLALLSYQTLLPSRTISPGTQQIIQHLQQDAVALASGSTSPPRGRASTREAQDLYNALADMFSLPHYLFLTVLLLDPLVLW